MKFEDYISVVVLEYLAPRLRGPKTVQALFSGSDVEDFYINKCPRNTNLDSEVVITGIENLIKYFKIEIIYTPHASPRFIASREAFIDFYRCLPGGDSDVALAWNLYRGLGFDWLAESIERSAFDDSDRAKGDDNSWSPLTIERADEDFQKALDSLHAVTDAVRGDNGYASTEPEERAEVLAGLNAATSYLSESPKATLSAIQSYIVFPLTRLIKRFKVQTIIGAAAKLAWEMFADWLKKRTGAELDGLFK